MGAWQPSWAPLATRWKGPGEARQGSSQMCHCCAQPGGEAQVNPPKATQALELEMSLMPSDISHGKG